jgi:hypothetical protein
MVVWFFVFGGDFMQQSECVKGVRILDCSVSKCVYNMNNQCHTPGITVGSMCPSCDTFQNGASKGGESDVNGAVGACRKDDCQFNQSMECQAPEGIHVGDHMFHADCLTYHKK